MISGAHQWHRTLANERKTRRPNNAAGVVRCHISVATIVHAICGRWWLRSVAIGLTLSSYNVYLATAEPFYKNAISKFFFKEYLNK